MKFSRKKHKYPEDKFKIMPDVVLDYVLDERVYISVYYNPELEAKFKLGRLIYKILYYLELNSRQGYYGQSYPKDVYEQHLNPPRHEVTYWEADIIDNIKSEQIINDCSNIPFFIDLEKKEIWEIFEGWYEKFDKFVKTSKTIKRAIVEIFSEEEPFVFPENASRLIIM